MASDLTPDDRRVFDETSLHEAIIRTWGEHGAHNDVFTTMRRQLSEAVGRIEALEAERDTLRRYLSDVVNALLDRLSDVEAERDAALAEVRKSYAMFCAAVVAVGGKLTIPENLLAGKDWTLARHDGPIERTVTYVALPTDTKEADDE